MNALWTHTEAGSATTGRSTGAWTATGVSIDSRTLEKGDLFVAIVGPNNDGHRFVAGALEAGAAAAVVDAAHAEAFADTGPLLVVEDTMRALEDLGRAARNRTEATVVGVTGSVGKTGTKEALALAFGAQGRTSAARGSLNNHWGLPLSLARMPADTEFGVFEMGMNHAGEIAALTKMVRPDVAVVTTIAAAHSEFFASEAAIADAKGEIFLGVPATGAAVLNRDNPHFERLSRHAEAAGVGRILGFGTHSQAQARLLDCSLHTACSAVTASVCGQTIDYTLGMPGRHIVMNSLAVLAAVCAAGADVTMAARALGRMRALKGRGERHRIRLAGGDFLLIDESYNANPTSVRAALEVLGRTALDGKGRRIAVLGDMLELGAEADRIHADLAADLVRNKVDLLFASGPLSENLYRAASPKIRGGHAADSAETARRVIEAVRPGDVVTVKGSAGSRMGRVVEALMALQDEAAEETQDQARPRAANGG